MNTICFGKYKKLRNGGRFGISSTLIKSLGSTNLEAIQGYLELLMKPEDKKRWKWFIEAKGQISSKVGAGTNGVDYLAMTYSEPGKYLPITLFLYEAPGEKLNIYWPEKGNTTNTSSPIPVISLPSPIPNNIVQVLSGNRLPNETEEEHKALSFRVIAYKVTKELLGKFEGIDTFPENVNNVSLGPDKIKIKDSYGVEYEVEPDFNLMVEDFSARVENSSSPIAKPANPAPGGKDKELLIIHPDATDWLSHLFGYKTKGLYAGMTTDNPDISLKDSEKSLSYHGEPIYQFDKGVLYEKTVCSGGRDRAVWRSDSWEDTPLSDEVIEKIKALYPGIQASDIFLSDED